MTVKMIEKLVPSTDGVHMLHGRIYVPEGEVRGLFQVVHGMAEHIGRYDDFMTYLAKLGYVVFGHDHIGHGKTAGSDDELGYFSRKDGYSYVVDDVYAFGKAVSENYPGKKIVMLGHSMGSFVVRLYAAKYPNSIDGLIIMGTGGKNPAAGIGIALASVIKFFCGEKHVSKLINNIAFGKYNDRTEKKTPKDWVTGDTEILAKYLADKYSGFDFTVSAMIDLMKMNRLSNEKNWYEAMPKTLPVLVVSGTEDPVGDYGEGPKRVAQGLSDAGLDDVTLRLFEGARHEVLNERCRAEVYAFISEWTEKIC